MSTPFDRQHPHSSDRPMGDDGDGSGISLNHDQHNTSQRKAAAHQRLKLKNQQHEIALRFKEVIHSHEVAMRNMDLYSDYIRNTPRHDFRQRLLLYALIVIVLLITMLFFVYCIYTGNRELVMRIIEIIVASLVSGGGGYVIGKNKKDKLPEAVSPVA